MRVERRAEGPRNSDNQQTRQDPRSRPKSRGVATAAATPQGVGPERCGPPGGKHGDGKGTATESGVMTVLNERLMEVILTEENLQAAHRQVKANGGAPGMDGMGVKALAEHLDRHGDRIKAKLLEGRYQPSPVRGVEIPKPQGGVRVLGIPTVQDRWLQQAIQQVLTPMFEPLFSDSSHGFRPGRRAHDAVQAAHGYVLDGKTWMVDIDLKAFFDHVNHDRLLYQLREQLGDPRVLSLIGRYLRAGMLHHGEVEVRLDGTPQGGPLSPLLANLYLTPLDRELERRGLAFCRYADDITVFVGSARSAERVLNSLVAWIEEHLKLPVNREKSGWGRPWERQMLGFRLLEDGRIGIAPKSIALQGGGAPTLGCTPEPDQQGTGPAVAALRARMVELFSPHRRTGGTHPPGWLGPPPYAQVLLAALA